MSDWTRERHFFDTRLLISDPEPNSDPQIFDFSLFSSLWSSYTSCLHWQGSPSLSSVIGQLRRVFSATTFGLWVILLALAHWTRYKLNWHTIVLLYHANDNGVATRVFNISGFTIDEYIEEYVNLLCRFKPDANTHRIYLSSIRQLRRILLTPQPAERFVFNRKTGSVRSGDKHYWR